MRAAFALLPLALLAACGSDPSPDPQPTSPVAVQTGPMESIEGEWTVTAVDGLRFTDGSGTVLDIGPQRIDFANCWQIGWVYTLVDGRITIERSRRLDEGNPEPCKDKVPIPLLQTISAIDSLKKAERTPRGGLRMTGGLRSLDLVSP